MLVSAEIPIKLQDKLYKYIDFPFIINIYRDIPEYRDFYIERCKEAPVSFLDNGLFEAIEHGIEYDMSLEALKEGVEIFHPTYVFSEEKYGDREFTVAKAKEFKEYFKDSVKIATCCHGSTFEEYEKCFNELVEISDCIAFSHVTPFVEDIINSLDNFPKKFKDDQYYKLAVARIHIITSILKNYKGDKPIHLLGCNHPIEIKVLRELFSDIIKTCDTSSPIIYGIEKGIYPISGILPEGKIRQGKGYINREYNITEDIEDLIRFNIDYLRGI